MNWEDIRLVIFDADGTLRVRKDREDAAPHKPEDWELMPGIEEAIDELRWHPIVFGIASNQACVARGEVDYRMAQMMLFDLSHKLNLSVSPSAIKMCPHQPHEKCSCRKPRPGMLNDIMKVWGRTPEETLFIGDALYDQQAAENAGCQFMQVEDFLGKE